MDGIEQLDDTRIRVAAGVTMTRAAVHAANLGLGGMEFAHGIPGTVGGGVYMNAGAYGGEICQICESVEVMDRDGNISTIGCSCMEFSYRHSRFSVGDGVVLSAENKKQLSGISSHSPSRIMRNPRSVSFNGTYCPGIPVNCSATEKG